MGNGKLGLTVGSALLGADIAGLEGVEIVQRHGTGTYRPPHLIDHPANLRLLAERGCDRVLGLCSVGSLREEIGVGSFVCPDDFIALQLGGSAFDHEGGHRIAGFDPQWRARVIEAWGQGSAAPLRDGGVYWQAIGPRFETAAEIRLISAHAAVVGMTVASECVVATELGLPYAAICVVDNLANGVGEEPLTLEQYEAGRGASREALGKAITILAAKLGGG